MGLFADVHCCFALGIQAHLASCHLALQLPQHRDGVIKLASSGLQIFGTTCHSVNPDCQNLQISLVPLLHLLQNDVVQRVQNRLQRHARIRVLVDLFARLVAAHSKLGACHHLDSGLLHLC